MTEDQPSFSYQVDPAELRRDLEDILRERYKDGLPVLKELVQNADDAHATALRFVLLEAKDVPDELPSLLGEPALVVANDGPFLTKHAKAIRQFRGSDKTGSSGAIGRFGLGLKSVFHWCEAFFHLHVGGDEGAVRQPPGFISPGAPNYRRAWSEEWAQKRHSALLARWADELPTKLGLDADGGGPWFVLWLPLRTKLRAPTHVLDAQWPGDDIDQFAQTLQKNWPAVWPLLGGAKTLRSIVIQTLGAYHSARISADNEHRRERLWRDLDGSNDNDCSPFRLDLCVDDAPATVYGWQRRTRPSEDFTQRHGWPKIAATSDQEVDRPIDSRPHAATWITAYRTPLPSKTKAQWACYLPIGDGAPDVDDSTETLTLHGGFLPDSGRRQIKLALDRASGNTEPGPADQVMVDWNRELAEAALGLLPQLIFDVLRFRDKLDLTDVGRVSQRIARVREALRDLATPKLDIGVATVGREVALVPRIDPTSPTGERYDLLSAEALAAAQRSELHLPPDASTVDVLADLPGLAVLAMSDGIHLRRADRAELGAPSSTALCPAHLTTLLRDAEPAAVRYLPDLLTKIPFETKRNADVQRGLVGLIRAALLEHENRPAGTRALGRLLELVEQERYVLLPERMGELGPHLLRSIESLLLIPPKRLAKAQRPDAQPTDRLADVRSRIVDAALGWLDDRLNDANHGSVVRLFRWLGEPPQRDGRRLPGRSFAPGASEGELQWIEPDDRRPRFERAKARRDDALCQAVADATGQACVLLDAAVANWGAAGAVEASIASVTDWIVDSRQRLAPDPGDRLALFHQLKADEPARGERRTVLRALLVGHHVDDARPLLQPSRDKSDLEQLARDLDGFVELDLAKKLNDEQKQHLGIEDVTPERVAYFINQLSHQDVTTREWPELGKREDREALLAAVNIDKTFRLLPYHDHVDGSDGPLVHGARLLPRTLRRHRMLQQLWPKSLDGGPLLWEAEFAETRNKQRAMVQPVTGRQLLEWVIDDEEHTSVSDPATLTAWMLAVLELDAGLASAPEVRTTPWVPTSEGQRAPETLADFGEKHELVRDGLSVVPPRATPEDLRNRLLELDVICRGPAAAEHVGRCLSSAYPVGPLATLCPHAFVQAFAEASDQAVMLVERLLKVGTSEARAALNALSGDLCDDRLIALLQYSTERAAGLEQTPPSIDDVLARLLPIVGERGLHDRLGSVYLPSRAGSWTQAKNLTWSSYEPPSISGAVRLQDTIATLLRLDRSRFDEPHTLELRPLDIGQFLSQFPVDERVRPACGVLAIILGYPLHAYEYLRELGTPDSIERAITWALVSEHEWARDLHTGARLLQLRLDDEAAHSAALAACISKQSIKQVVADLLRHNEALAYYAENVARCAVGESRPTDRHRLLEAVRHLREACDALCDLNLLHSPAVLVENSTSVQRVLAITGAWLAIETSSPSPDRQRSSLFLRRRAHPNERIEFRPNGVSAITEHTEVLRRTIYQVTKERFGDEAGRGIKNYLDALLRAPVEAVEEFREELLSGKSHWIVSRAPAIVSAVSEWPRLSDPAERRRRLKEAIEQSSDEIVDDLAKQMRDFGYTAESILFELLQNADDAVVQLLGLGGQPGDALHIHHRRTPNCSTLDVAHWGRAINQTFVPTSSTAEQLEYASDIYYMLMRLGSGKHRRADDTRSETGCFGLGFKSVFICSRQPFIAGGRLPPLRVVAGSLPEFLEETSPEAEDLRSDLARFEDRVQRGATLIRLPLRPEIDGPALVDHFRARLDVALLFCQRIRRIEITHERTEVHAPDLRFFGSGPLGVATLGRRSGTTPFALVAGFEARPRTLIFLASTGLAAIPADIAAFWSLAPTRIQATSAFCFNADFDLQPGRTNLADNPTAHTVAVAGLRETLATALRQLMELRADWPTQRAALGLPDCEFEKLIASIWRAARDAFRGEGLPDRVGAAVLWGRTDGDPTDWPSHGALHALADAGGFPSSLEARPALLHIDNAVVQVTGLLADRALFDKLAPHLNWSVETAVDESAAACFERLRRPPPTAKSMAHALEALTPGHQCAPEIASLLGGLGIEWTASSESPEHAKFQAGLRALKFRTSGGQWLSALSQSSGWSSKYDANGMRFIEACQSLARMEDARLGPPPLVVGPAAPPPPKPTGALLAALAQAWRERADLHAKHAHLNGLYAAVGLPTDVMALRERLGHGDDEASFKEGWFRLLCGLSVLSALGEWDRHVGFLERLMRQGDALGQVWRGALREPLESGLFGGWTSARRGPDLGIEGGDFTLHWRFLVDFEKFRQLVKDYDYAHALLACAGDPRRADALPKLAYRGQEGRAGARPRPAAGASLKRFTLLLARELWRHRIVARTPALGSVAFAVTRHSYRAAAALGLIQASREPPTDFDKLVAIAMSAREAITEKARPEDRDLFDTWCDIPFLAYQTDGALRAVVDAKCPGQVSSAEGEDEPDDDRLFLAADLDLDDED